MLCLVADLRKHVGPNLGIPNSEVAISTQLDQEVGPSSLSVDRVWRLWYSNLEFLADVAEEA